MKLLFKQRFFSWFDSYDIYDEAGSTVYTGFLRGYDQTLGMKSYGACVNLLVEYYYPMAQGE